jgi:H+/Cl- antiporter ClcA
MLSLFGGAAHTPLAMMLIVGAMMGRYGLRLARSSVQAVSTPSACAIVGGRLYQMMRNDEAKAVNPVLAVLLC